MAHEYWRDYHFDFCGNISYDNNGIPQDVAPVDDSGYSVGCLQLDFGQTTAAAQPFVTAFDNWHQANPGSLGLVSTPQFAVKALTSDGQKLKANPATALRRQDVEAFSAFVLSPDGSDWVNTNIDDALIGSDQQIKSIYGGGLTLVGIARQMEATAAFKTADSAKNTAVTDLLYAMTMKAYNQAPGDCTKLLTFLNTGPSVADIVSWPQSFSGAFRDGVSAAVSLSQMWTKLITPAGASTVPAWLADLQTAMDTQGLANPRKTSAASGVYVAAKQIFESSDYFPRFAQAMQAGTDYIPSALFDPASGAIRTESQTGRITQGVMVKDKIGYVWDTASNGYQMANEAWTSIPIGQITSTKALV